MYTHSYTSPQLYTPSYTLPYTLVHSYTTRTHSHTHSYTLIHTDTQGQYRRRPCLSREGKVTMMKTNQTKCGNVEKEVTDKSERTEGSNEGDGDVTLGKDGCDGSDSGDTIVDSEYCKGKTHKKNKPRCVKPEADSSASSDSEFDELDPEEKIGYIGSRADKRIPRAQERAAASSHTGADQVKDPLFRGATGQLFRKGKGDARISEKEKEEVTKQEKEDRQSKERAQKRERATRRAGRSQVREKREKQITEQARKLERVERIHYDVLSPEKKREIEEGSKEIAKNLLGSRPPEELDKITAKAGKSSSKTHLSSSASRKPLNRELLIAQVRIAHEEATQQRMKEREPAIQLAREPYLQKQERTEQAGTLTAMDVELVSSKAKRKAEKALRSSSSGEEEREAPGSLQSLPGLSTSNTAKLLDEDGFQQIVSRSKSKKRKQRRVPEGFNPRRPPPKLLRAKPPSIAKRPFLPESNATSEAISPCKNTGTDRTKGGREDLYITAELLAQGPKVVKVEAFDNDSAENRTGPAEAQRAFLEGPAQTQPFSPAHLKRQLQSFLLDDRNKFTRWQADKILLFASKYEAEMRELEIENAKMKGQLLASKSMSDRILDSLGTTSQEVLRTVQAIKSTSEQEAGGGRRLDDIAAKLHKIDEKMGVYDKQLRPAMSSPPASCAKPPPPKSYALIVRGDKEPLVPDEVTKRIREGCTGEINLRVRNIRTTKNGVIIETPTARERKALVESGCLKAAGLKAKTPKNILPRIVVLDVPPGIEDIKLLAGMYKHSLYERVSQESFTRSVRIIRRTKRVNGNENITIELDKSIRDLLMEDSRVYLEWCSYRIINCERDRIQQCFNCYRYGHSIANCSRPRACWKCSGEGHLAEQCPATEQCHNCKEQGKGDYQHGPTSWNCPELARRLEALRTKIEYG